MLPPESSFHNIRLPVIVLLLILLNSCATVPPSPSPQTEFYVVPEVTYLRESPEYEGTVVNQLQRGDRVMALEAGDSPWWLVQQVPDGQTGWLPKNLLSPDPVPGNVFYVNQNKVPLLSCPKPDCPSLAVLSFGERVTKLEEQPSGWWRVQTAAASLPGWLPAAALSPHLDEIKLKQPAKEYYYVALKTLGLRSKPWINDPVIKTLQFNEQVHKISENSLGWYKVIVPADGSRGWVLSRYLQPLPSPLPRATPSKSKPRLLKPKKSLPPEPDIM